MAWSMSSACLEKDTRESAVRGTPLEHAWIRGRRQKDMILVTPTDSLISMYGASCSSKSEPPVVLVMESRGRGTTLIRQHVWNAI